MAQHDPDVIPTAAFTETDKPAVDAAYEFVFTNIAMMLEGEQTRQYLVMPHFLSCSSTSLEKWALEVEKMIAALPDCRGKVQLTTFHPEHVDSKKRAPFPVLALQRVEEEES